MFSNMYSTYNNSLELIICCACLYYKIFKTGAMILLFYKIHAYIALVFIF
jgi:hypothetical protein